MKLVCACMGIVAGLFAGGASAAPYDRVMLVSIDGMHAIDLATYVASHPQGTLAALSQHGVS